MIPCLVLACLAVHVLGHAVSVPGMCCACCALLVPGVRSAAVLCGARRVLCLLCCACWPVLEFKRHAPKLAGFGHAGEQAELLPCDAEIERVLGVSLRGVEGMDKSVRQVLAGDTSAISTLRCLKLYLERMGTDFQNASELQRIAGSLLPALYLTQRCSEGVASHETAQTLSA